MVRRPPKPFTVEIRSSRRKPGAPAAIGQDQPHVEWPSAMIEALRETPVPAPPPVAEERQERRILPALDEPTPPSVPDHASTELEDETSEMDVDLARNPEEEAPARQEQPVAIETNSTPPLQREGRARRSRDEFARGERWKARLPAAVHRTRRSSRKP